MDKINNSIVLPGFYKTTKIQEKQKKAETRVEEGERAQGREPVKDRMASWELNLYFINIPAAKLAIKPDRRHDRECKTTRQRQGETPAAGLL